MRKYVLLAEKLGADEAEVARLYGHSLSVSKEGRDVEAKEFSASEGFSVRVLKGKRIGFAYFGVGERPEGAIKRALSLSKFSKESGFAFPSSAKCPKVPAFDKKIGRLGEAQAAGLMEDAASSVEKPSKVSKVGLEFGVSETELENSSGLSASRSSTRISCFASCTAGKSSGYSYRDSRFFDFEPKDVGREASERAIEMEKGKPMKTGRIPAVLEADALSSLFYSLLFPSFNGERAYRKISALHDKLGQKAASESLTFSDDPLFPGPGATPFDGEGIPSKKKALIECGVVSNFLFDGKTAALAGKELMPAPGNCRRGSHMSEPGIGGSNLVVDSGKDKDALEICKGGILVCSVFGEHTANDLTGEFSVSVDRGFEIKNGEKGKPVRGNVISGNVFELIKKITAIEKKQERAGSFISPRIAFGEMQVVGK